MFRLICCAVFAAAIAVGFVPVPAAAGKALTAAERAAKCEKLKKAGNYDTPLGRASAKAMCVSLAEARKDNGILYWREITRQNKCMAKTGKVCPD